MGGPASSTRVFRPFSVSSFAAHPPEMPEPTTIASYARNASSDRDTAIVSSRNGGSLDQVRGHGFGGEIGEYREVLQHPERALRAHRLPGECRGLGRRRVRWWAVPFPRPEQPLLGFRASLSVPRRAQLVALRAVCFQRTAPSPLAV